MEIDIENLRKERLPLVGKYSGVYFLFDNGELVYIGESWNCFLGVAEFTRKNKKFTKWNFVKIKDKEEREKVKKELVKEHKPKYNTR